MQTVRDPRDPRRVKEVIDQLVRQFDNTGSFTLTANASSTIVKNQKVSGISRIILEPRDANAAAARGTTFISAIADGQFTITHASAATVRKFDYVVFGVG